MWWHHEWTGWNWFFMVMSMAVFWGLLVAAIVWALHVARGRSGAPPVHRSARETLDDRFARGEITEEEYRRSRDALSER